MYWKLKNINQKTVPFVDVGCKEGHYYGTPALEYPGLVKVNAIFYIRPEVILRLLSI